MARERPEDPAILDDTSLGNKRNSKGVGWTHESSSRDLPRAEPAGAGADLVALAKDSDRPASEANRLARCEARSSLAGLGLAAAAAGDIGG